MSPVSANVVPWATGPGARPVSHQRFAAPAALFFQYCLYELHARHVSELMSFSRMPNSCGCSATGARLFLSRELFRLHFAIRPNDHSQERQIGKRRRINGIHDAVCHQDARC